MATALSVVIYAAADLLFAWLLQEERCSLLRLKHMVVTDLTPPPPKAPPKAIRWAAAADSAGRRR